MAPTTKTTNTAGDTFAEWYKKVDRRISARAGIGVDDLADGLSWDAWNDDIPVNEYADDLLAAEGFPG